MQTNPKGEISDKNKTNIRRNLRVEHNVEVSNQQHTEHLATRDLFEMSKRAF